MKNYSVIYKTNSGQIVEHEFDSLKLAYILFCEIVAHCQFEWAEMADHREAEIFEYVENPRPGYKIVAI